MYIHFFFLARLLCWGITTSSLVPSVGILGYWYKKKGGSVCAQYICDTLAFLFESTCWRDKGVLFSRSVLSSQGKELTCAVIKAGKFQLAECARG